MTGSSEPSLPRIPPAPTAQLAGCMWLPRILWKARHTLRGTLPESFRISYCAPQGVDGQFLAFFKLDQAGIEALAQLSDEAATEAFLALPGNSPERIAEWNHIGTHLGLPGYPMADRMQKGRETAYKHVATPERDTVFKLLEADDALL